MQNQKNQRLYSNQWSSGKGLEQWPLAHLMQPGQTATVTPLPAPVPETVPDSRAVAVCTLKS